ncbi:spermidine synthase [Salmonella enterica subsp. salamae]|uniref:Spermidine synthase n=1 Tax=Salmonella enterica subsp. salamae TaxID=59202 RepID=A0A6D2GF89_SALER|nr:spermidine synthase [Salmonella enterica subsp. salamae]
MAENTMWHETLHDQFGQYFAVDNVLYHEKTDHQDLIIFENAAFGRVMALDGVVQTTERDEFIYHEMMTHVPLLAHGHAKHVLIIGGGDGAMLREVTRHKNVETITMVEIDAGVVSFLPPVFTQPQCRQLRRSALYAGDRRRREFRQSDPSDF